MLEEFIYIDTFVGVVHVADLALEHGAESDSLAAELAGVCAAACGVKLGLFTHDGFIRFRQKLNYWGIAAEIERLLVLRPVSS